MKVGVTLSLEFVTPLKNNEITALFNSSLATIALSITDEKYFDNVDQSMSRLSLFISCSSWWEIESRKIHWKENSNLPEPQRIFLYWDLYLSERSFKEPFERGKQERQTLYYGLCNSFDFFIGWVIYLKSSKANVFIHYSTSREENQCLHLRT